MIIVRYADDLVVGFEHEDDARRFWDAMRDRFEEFSLSLHPEKTRLIEFGRHAAADAPDAVLENRRPSTFLASPSSAANVDGELPIQRKTRRDRMRAKLKEIKEEMRRRMHQSIPEQGTG